MRNYLSVLFATILLAFGAHAGAAEMAAPATATKPLKVLLVTGGGFHDFNSQRKTLVDGLKLRANLDIAVVQEGEVREHRMSIYEKAGWAQGYDVIVHNECFGLVADKDFTERIAAPHKNGVPAVILHATVHSYRNAPTDAWREVIGQKSMSHETKRDLVVKSLAAAHPIMKGFPAEWPDAGDELYKIEKAWPGVTPLAKAYGVETKQDHTVIWTNVEGKTRSFCTTLGHSDETMKAPVYLDLVTRGLLWACGKLTDDGKPMPGYGPGGK